MTLARPAGFVPAGPVSISDGLSRGAAFAAVGVLAALNAQADQIIANLSWQSPFDTFLTLGGVSAIVWAAMVAAWKVGGEGLRPLRRRHDLPVMAVIILLCFVPVSYAAQLGLLLCGCHMLATADYESAERRAALILLALTGPLIWGRLMLRLFEAQILALDARIVGLAIGSDTSGNIVRFPNATGQFIVGDPCSSVHNMSLAIVLWTTAAMLFGVRIDRRYVQFGLAMVMLMFGMNIVRLSIMGLFPENFEFLHVGAGAVLFAWSSLIGATLLAGFGIIDASSRQR